MSGNLTVFLDGSLVRLRDELERTLGFPKSQDPSMSFYVRNHGWGVPSRRKGYVDVDDDRRPDSSLVPCPY